jgi:hypothetical protein
VGERISDTKRRHVSSLSRSKRGRCLNSSHDAVEFCVSNLTNALATSEREREESIFSVATHRSRRIPVVLGVCFGDGVVFANFERVTRTGGGTNECTSSHETRQNVVTMKGQEKGGKRRAACCSRRPRSASVTLSALKTNVLRKQSINGKADGDVIEGEEDGDEEEEVEEEDEQEEDEEDETSDLETTGEQEKHVHELRVNCASGARVNTATMSLSS